jgi:hypothetical protein
VSIQSCRPFKPPRSRIRPGTATPPIPGVEWGTGAPPPKKVKPPGPPVPNAPGNRKGTFLDMDDEAVASLARGQMIASLDDIAVGPVWSRACEEFRRTGNALLLLQAVQLALFPEEFMNPDEPHDPGLIPRNGVIPRIGAARFRRFAEVFMRGETRGAG